MNKVMLKCLNILYPLIPDNIGWEVRINKNEIHFIIFSKGMLELEDRINEAFQNVEDIYIETCLYADKDINQGDWVSDICIDCTPETESSFK
jgi:hypothetical protein